MYGWWKVWLKLYQVSEPPLRRDRSVEDLVERQPEEQQDIEREWEDPHPRTPQGPAARARRGTRGS